MAITEFLISEALNHENHLIARGICNQGVIKLGQVFSALISEDEGSKEITLIVVKIITYRREIDELPTGMTAELHLTGDFSDLKHGDMLTG